MVFGLTQVIHFVHIHSSMKVKQVDLELRFWFDNISQRFMPSVLGGCWLGVRKSTRPVNVSVMRSWWLSVWSEVQMMCMWSS